MDCLIECADGDLRKSVTYLQTAHSLKGEEDIEKCDVLKITGVSVLLRDFRFCTMYYMDCNSKQQGCGSGYTLNPFRSRFRF